MCSLWNKVEIRSLQILNILAGLFRREAEFHRALECERTGVSWTCITIIAEPIIQTLVHSLRRMTSHPNYGQPSSADAPDCQVYSVDISTSILYSAGIYSPPVPRLMLLSYKQWNSLRQFRNSERSLMSKFYVEFHIDSGLTKADTNTRPANRIFKFLAE